MQSRAVFSFLLCSFSNLSSFPRFFFPLSFSVLGPYRRLTLQVPTAHLYVDSQLCVAWEPMGLRSVLHLFVLPPS